MRRTLLAGLLVLGAVATSDAQTMYRSVDKTGQVHMTDDPNMVPKGATPDALTLQRASVRAQYAALCQERELRDGARTKQMQLICDDLAREDAQEILKVLRSDAARRPVGR